MKGYIGVDIGGSGIQSGLVLNGNLSTVNTQSITTDLSESEVLDKVISLIEQSLSDQVEGIGIGVPSLVDVENGIVYDTINIPSWKKVHLKFILEKHFKLPVYVNNDANCFVMGEKIYGSAINTYSCVGLVMGTGLGAGIVINHQLHNGRNCGAGEIGLIPYKDHNYEYYCSGRFFENCYSISGLENYNLAMSGNSEAIRRFEIFGDHLGNALKVILLAYDPDLIVLGGSLKKAFPFFGKAMWASVKTLELSYMISDVHIVTSALDHIAILGAAALCEHDKLKSKIIELRRKIQ